MKRVTVSLPASELHRLGQVYAVPTLTPAEEARRVFLLHRVVVVVVDWGISPEWAIPGDDVQSYSQLPSCIVAITEPLMPAASAILKRVLEIESRPTTVVVVGPPKLLEELLAGLKVLAVPRGISPDEIPWPVVNELPDRRPLAESVMIALGLTNPLEE